MTENRYFLDQICIDGIDVAANEAPAKYIKSDFYKVDFRPNEKTVYLQSCNSNDDGAVRVVYDKTLEPSPGNKVIGCACLGTIVAEQSSAINLRVGPNIVRAESLSTFPGKISFAGGLFERQDYTLLRTVVRELTEELSLNDYLPMHIQDKLYTQSKLTHFFISHPLAGTARRFNVVFVYVITLITDDLKQFRSDKFDSKEVASVQIFNLDSLIKSLIENNPYESKGWTPNGAMVVLDIIKSHIPSLNNINITNSSQDNLLKILKILKTDHKTTNNLINPTTPFNLFTSSKLETPANSVTASKLGTSFNLDSPKIQENKPIYKLKNNNNLENLLDRYGEFSIKKINPQIIPIAVAEDLAYKFKQSNQFVTKHVWRGYVSPRDRDSNYKQQHDIFDRILDNLKTFGVKYTLDTLEEGGNEYYNEGPEQVGYILSLSSL
jgi:8-oxo-dGTP pyrophosphatase MutT (NUDIX family)